MDIITDNGQTGFTKNENESFLRRALEYQKMGFSIIPLRIDKTPHIKWEAFQKQKAKIGDVTGWWKKWTDANIGVVTGSISGLVVVDVDDMKIGLSELAKVIPVGIETPTAQTPSGGLHFYFKHPDRRIECNRKTIPGCDFQGDGGYVVAPPSYCEYIKHGKDIKGSYTWVKSPDDCTFAPLPEAYINAFDSFNNNSLYKGGKVDTLQHLTDLTEPYRYFIEGRRDEDIFRIANALVKANCAPGIIQHVLNILALSCDPPFPEKDINAKIQSALQRAARRERNLLEEIRTWWTLQEGYTDLTNMKQTLQLLTKEERNHADVIIHRLKEEGFIEKYGNKAGVYRRVDKDFERVDFLSASGRETNINLPLDLNDLAKLYAGSIIVVAGSKEAGKTAFLLNIALANLGKKRIVYLNSEMGEDELKNRLLNFGNVKLETWAEKMEVFRLKPTQTPADFIDGSDTIWIVDYLEIAEDFSKIALPIAHVHGKLGNGLAFIGLQKADDKEIGRGADFSREKARLYISLDWDSERRQNRIKIIDCKAWRDRNPRGLYRYYKLVKGAGIIPQGNWQE
ncbi:MAG: bifunctional DNA primase/polymerase [Proteobacteria bacterium]|nr:bifunctional DNA primase/polymerase [Pseudomonadota bacterium]